MMNLAELNMDAFSDGQMSSKLWLCENLESFLAEKPRFQETWIYGSWYGLLALLLLVRGKISLENIHLFDIDERALSISKKVLDHWKHSSSAKIFFHSHDCLEYPNFLQKPDLVINTSVEHFEDFSWWRHLPAETHFVLQSTDMVHPEHISPIESLENFKQQLQLKEKPLFEGVRSFDYPNLKFQRFMLIGKKM
jgi:hypothetical protein